tara:strand:- start:271 stop:651 length:381 start_codon:yes stop_codon:yes gene_type:complete
MKIKLLFLISMLILTSCSTINKSYVNAPVGVSATVTLDADVTLGYEISGSAEETTLLGLFRLSGPTKYADNVFGGLKAAAAYDALEDTDADVIVNPQYVYEVNNALIIKTVTCTVTGTAGKINVKN